MKRIIGLLALLLALVCVGCAMTSRKGAEADVELRDLTWAAGGVLPKAEDFVVSMSEGCSVKFARYYTFDSLKEYTISLIVTDAKGRESEYSVKLNLVKEDTTPPTVTGLKDLLIPLNGGGISYLSGVKAQDNCDNGVTLRVDNAQVNLSAVGVYPVWYIATDAQGNTAEYRMSVTVYEQEITKEMLWDLLDPVIASIIEDGMTLEEQLYEIYEYVHDSIAYTDTGSDKSDWVRGAYEALKWHQGDCYTYFALSKAFFERLGIENMDVQRASSVVALVDERHFWNLVNVGSEKNPRWYHFDACRFKDFSKPWGYLMTDAQLESYTETKISANGVGDYFYVYDKEGYPATSTQKINTDY
ncbi:MAG: transglutaminase domain-containing protein [Clostridia bacterium]|nr:transglutaminase domain-containing protein [Clostridia bacterium]